LHKRNFALSGSRNLPTLSSATLFTLPFRTCDAFTLSFLTCDPFTLSFLSEAEESAVVLVLAFAVVCSFVCHRSCFLPMPVPLFVILERSEGSAVAFALAVACSPKPTPKFRHVDRSNGQLHLQLHLSLFLQPTQKLSS
jgi:hypothetical protein